MGNGTRRGGLAALMAVLLTAGGVAGQTLAIEEELPASSVLCDPAARAPTCGRGDRTEVERLVNDATQAMILGDLTRADELLTEALELDPCAVEATYLRGRIVARTRDPEAASEWFCRYLALAPFGASAQEARRRLEQAVEGGAGAELRDGFDSGVARYRAGELDRAEEAFTAVLDRHPVPEAFYNRALIRIAQDRPEDARTDLERYVELAPDGERRAIVADALSTPEDWAPKSPTTAFVLGAVLPGAGQYYTDRVGFGLTVTGIVAGAAAAGYFFERTTIQCRAPDPSGECPPSAIAGTETERPFLVAALGVGGGLMLLSAIEAALHAGGREPPLTVATVAVDGTRARIEVGAHPTLSNGSVDIHLVVLRH